MSNYLTTGEFGAVETMMSRSSSVCGPIALEDDPSWIITHMRDAARESVSVALGLFRLENVNVKYAFIISDRQNACCSRLIENSYIILITTGMLEKMFQSAQYICAFADVASTLNLKSKPQFFTAPSPQANGQMPSLPMVIENEELGREALPYAQLALGFIIGHEFGHLINGHVGAAKMIEEEYKFTTADTEKFVTMQTLEMDADSVAGQLLFDLVFKRLDRWLIELNLPLEEMSGMIIAIAAATIALADHQILNVLPTSVSLMSLSHPENLHRLISVKAVLAQRYCIVTNIDESKGHEKVISATHAFTTAVISLGSFSLNRLAICQVGANLEDEHDMYVQRVGRRWAIIRPLLESRALGRCSLAVPNFDPESFPLEGIIPDEVI